MSTGQKLSVILIAGLLGMITSKLVLEVFLSRAVSWTGNFRKGRRNNFAAISVHVCSTLAQEHVCMHIAMELITTIITFFTMLHDSFMYTYEAWSYNFCHFHAVGGKPVFSISCFMQHLLSTSLPLIKSLLLQTIWYGHSPKNIISIGSWPSFWFSFALFRC